MINEFLNAYTFAFCERRGFTNGAAWRWSLAELKRTTGCNAIILPVCAWQEHTYSTKVEFDTPDVMDETDIKNVCSLAHEMGFKVILKAMVNCRDGYWRAYIHFTDNYLPTEPSWADWFGAYGAHVLRLAKMAGEFGAEMFCVGCEMVGANHRDAEWRELIEKVRQVYTGPVTYNCDKYQEDFVRWWDACDIISSSGYYPIDEIGQNFDRIQKVAERFDRPFMFMECGCPSRLNSAKRPNDWRFGGETSQQEQLNWYEAFLREIKNHPFVRGTGWWDWPASRLYAAQTASDNGGYCTYGKTANDAIKRFSDRLSEENK